MITLQNNQGGRPAVELELTAEVDDGPFLAVVLTEEDDGREVADLLITDLATADAFLEHVSTAVAEFRRLAT